MDCISQTTNCPETAEILAKIEELEIQKKKFIKAIKNHCIHEELTDTELNNENHSEGFCEREIINNKTVDYCCHHNIEYKQLLTIPDKIDDNDNHYVEKFLIKIYNNCLVDNKQNHRFLIVSTFEKYLKEKLESDKHFIYKVLKIFSIKVPLVINKYIRNLFCYKRIQKYLFSLYEKFPNNLKDIDFETVAKDTSCISCFKKDIYFMIKELNNILQAFIKASKIFYKLFKNDFDDYDISFEDIHKEEFWKRLTDDVYICSIIHYIKLNDCVRDSKEIFINIEEDCKIFSNGMNDLLSFLKKREHIENKTIKDTANNLIDIEELINQIKIIDDNKINKKRKVRLDSEIDQFKKILKKETVNSFKIHKIKPIITTEWIEKIKQFN